MLHVLSGVAFSRFVACMEDVVVRPVGKFFGVHDGSHLM